MKTMIAGALLAMAAIGGLLLSADGNQGGGGGGDMEVTKNPAILVSPSMKAGDVTVHGVRLGDPVAKIANDPAFRREDVSERPQDIVYVGADAAFYAYAGKVYRITVMGDLAKQIPTYDAVRLQMALGKADDVGQSASGEEARLNFYARRVQYTTRAFRVLSVVVAVDLYAP
jgi:hypothetical protein